MHDNIKQGLVLGTHPLFGPGSKGVVHKKLHPYSYDNAETNYAEDFKGWLTKKAQTSS